MLDQPVDKACRDIQLALVFGQVALLVRLVEQQPLLRRETQRVFQALEDEIAIVAAITMLTQRRQGGRMRRVIRQVEAAFQRQYACLASCRRTVAERSKPARSRASGGSDLSWPMRARFASACELDEFIVAPFDKNLGLFEDAHGE